MFSSQSNNVNQILQNKKDPRFTFNKHGLINVQKIKKKTALNYELLASGRELNSLNCNALSWFVIYEQHVSTYPYVNKRRKLRTLRFWHNKRNFSLNIRARFFESVLRILLRFNKKKITKLPEAFNKLKLPVMTVYTWIRTTLFLNPFFF